MKNKRRLIDAEKLEARMCDLCDEFGTDHLFIDAIIYEIGNAPTMDAVEVVHGWWVHHYNDSDEPIDDKWYCSECHMCNDHKRTWYCPNCGAKMDK